MSENTEFSLIFLSVLEPQTLYKHHNLSLLHLKGKAFAKMGEIL